MHIAPASEHIEQLLGNLLINYANSDDKYFLERIARFHLVFGCSHPFNIGNRWIGPMLAHVQLSQWGYPSIIIRNKGKQDNLLPSIKMTALRQYLIICCYSLSWSRYTNVKHI